MTTNIDLCNRALAFTGTRSQLTDLVSTTEGKYCALMYDDLRDLLLRNGDYDFSLTSISATSVTPIPGWAFAYTYPTACVRLRQLVPAVLDPLDPQPVQWNIAAGTTILTTLAIATILFTTNAITETLWDPTFTDAFVRMLGSGIAFALENRIEAHKVAIQEALEFATLGAGINP